MDSATKKSNIHVKNHQKICLGAWEHMLRLVPGWPRITLTEHKKMLYESFKYIPRDPPQGNTCVSMAKMRKMSPKACQNEKFFFKILKFFRKVQDQLKWCFMMFFDVLELWEPSWNDSGSIWDHSFFHHFHHHFHDFLVDRRCSRSLALSVCFQWFFQISSLWP